jgi:hypothetical protein
MIKDITQKNTEDNITSVSACIAELRAAFIGLYSSRKSDRHDPVKINDLKLEKDSPFGIFDISVLIECLTQVGEQQSRIAMRRSPNGSSARFSLLEHHRDPMAREQLFAGFQGLVLISSEERHHPDSFGQVSDHVE